MKFKYAYVLATIAAISFYACGEDSSKTTEVIEDLQLEEMEKIEQNESNLPMKLDDENSCSDEITKKMVKHLFVLQQ